MKVVGKRNLQSIDTKKKIIKASIFLIEKLGYENLRIREICELAGVSTGTFYHYFSSKEDILLEQISRGFDFTKEKVLPLLTHNNIFDNIDVYMFYQMEQCVLMPISVLRQALKLFLFNVKGSTLSRESFNFHLINQLIADSQESGELKKEVASEVIADLFIRMIIGTCFSWCMQNGDFNIIQESQAHARLILNSVQSGNLMKL